MADDLVSYGLGMASSLGVMLMKELCDKMVLASIGTILINTLYAIRIFKASSK